jgi:hypothetical protein
MDADQPCLRARADERQGGGGHAERRLRAFSLTSLIAQRDAGTGRWTLRAASSSFVLAAWTATAGFTAENPGMAACRGPARWMTGSWCHLRTGIQIEDADGVRIGQRPCGRAE